MASYMSNYCLNLAADHVTNRTIQLRAHSASPGNSGTWQPDRYCRCGRCSVGVGRGVIRVFRH